MHGAPVCCWLIIACWVLGWLCFVGGCGLRGFDAKLELRAQVRSRASAWERGRNIPCPLRPVVFLYEIPQPQRSLVRRGCEFVGVGFAER